MLTEIRKFECLRTHSPREILLTPVSFIYKYNRQDSFLAASICLQLPTSLFGETNMLLFLVLLACGMKTCPAVVGSLCSSKYSAEGACTRMHLSARDECYTNDDRPDVVDRFCLCCSASYRLVSSLDCLCRTETPNLAHCCGMQRSCVHTDLVAAGSTAGSSPQTPAVCIWLSPSVQRH